MKTKNKKRSFLAFDTSSSRFVCVYHDGVRAQSRVIEGSNKHSESIFAALQGVLKNRRPDVIIVGLGPGSFTGLRIGVTAAKSLAYAFDSELLGISSLQILSRNPSRSAGPVLVIQDAKRGQVYVAAYEDSRCLLKPCRMTRVQFEEKKHAGKPDFWNNAQMIGEDALPTVRGLLLAAEVALSGKRRDNIFSLKPDYLYEDTCNVDLKK